MHQYTQAETRHISMSFRVETSFDKSFRWKKTTSVVGAKASENVCEMYNSIALIDDHEVQNCVPLPTFESVLA